MPKLLMSGFKRFRAIKWQLCGMFSVLKDGGEIFSYLDKRIGKNAILRCRRTAADRVLTVEIAGGKTAHFRLGSVSEPLDENPLL